MGAGVTGLEDPRRGGRVQDGAELGSATTLQTTELVRPALAFFQDLPPRDIRRLRRSPRSGPTNRRGRMRPTRTPSREPVSESLMVPSKSESNDK